MAEPVIESAPTAMLAELHRSVGLRAADEVLANDGGAVDIGPLAVNYYSFTFSVGVGAGSRRREAFVKIPKTDMRGLTPAILPLSAEDRRLAEEEAASLSRLASQWRGDDLGVTWVKLRGSLPEFNALVTERAFGEEAFLAFRRFDMRRRLGFRRDADRLRSVMARFGAALGRFHAAQARPSAFRLADERPKFAKLCGMLAEFLSPVWLRGVTGTIESLGDLELEASASSTLKGIDVRNILIDERDRLQLLDPGKMKTTHGEADLARFLMTYRAVYWGSPLLLALRRPDHAGEDALLEAYAAQRPFAPAVLDWYLLKEQLKHWHTALDSLRRLPWPAPAKKLTEALYVDPFYRPQVVAQLGRVRRRS